MVNPVIKNVSFVFVANIIATAVTAILTIWIPKVLSYEGYGYWQLNMLYGGYVALLHFGLIDGVYLRYAGTKYDNLDKNVQRAQFRFLFCGEILISLLAIIACYFYIENKDRMFAISSVFASSCLSIPMGMLLFLLQGGGRVKEYSIVTIVNRLVYLAICVLLLFCGIYDFKLIIIAGIIGSIFAFLYSCFLCRDIVFGKINLPRYSIIHESFENIKCGIKISIAYLTGNFIVGAVRLGIENEWGIETFGKVSMSLSLTHFLLIFINAVGVVLLPILRNVSQEMQKQVYVNLNKILTTIVYISFILCLPIKEILVEIIPQYSESLEWLILLIPIVLFEARTALLNGVYLRANRRENAFFIINVAMATCSVFATLFSVKVIHDFMLSVLLIPLLLGIKCTLLDIYINKCMGIPNVKETINGLLVSVVFIILSSIIPNNNYGIFLYLLFIIVLFMCDSKNQRIAFSWFVSKATKH